MLFRSRIAEARAAGPRKPHGDRPDQPPPSMSPGNGPAVGQITEQGLRLFEAKRQSEGRKAAQHGIALERTDDALPPPTNDPDA